MSHRDACFCVDLLVIFSWDPLYKVNIAFTTILRHTATTTGVEH